MIPEKIDLSGIFSAHLETLRRVGAKHISMTDIVVFFAIPVLLALAAAALLEVKDEGDLNTIIAVYAIFSALLINAQIALYTIYRSWPDVAPHASEKQTKNQGLRQDKRQTGKTLVREVNSNLSYLTVICVVALILGFLFSLVAIQSTIEIFISIFLFVHFVLTLSMAIKRTFRLFDAEFQ